MLIRAMFYKDISVPVLVQEVKGMFLRGKEFHGENPKAVRSLHERHGI